ncbi:related to Transcriptional regulatory protein PHO23 [Saccharomycodes ludwigii]|uniref:Chromatin modification-related protein n=1 Tax=Saccharomycodes ludwigii TaxID=36035 RepID=A0A376B890_9ASCO|nr:related to Transcriptional regulatory protein PHO23 [Saccharomycodes ludwigii]
MTSSNTPASSPSHISTHNGNTITSDPQHSHSTTNISIKHPANLYPGLNDINDILEELPLEYARYLTLLKEIDAKCFNFIPNLRHNIKDLLNEVGDNNNNINSSSSISNNLLLINQYFHDLMPSLEEKLHVSSIAVENINKLIKRLELSYEISIKNEEIPIKLRLGDNNHPAMHLHYELMEKAGKPEKKHQRRGNTRSAVHQNSNNSNSDSNSNNTNTIASNNGIKGNSSSSSSSSNNNNNEKVNSDDKNNSSGNKKSSKEIKDDNKTSATKKSSKIDDNTGGTDAATNMTTSSNKNNDSDNSNNNENKKRNHNGSSSNIGNGGKPKKRKYTKSGGSNTNTGNNNEKDLLYCYCNNVAYGEMVGCDGKDCQIEWFHLPCIGLKTLPRGKWYCKDCLNK